MKYKPAPVPDKLRPDLRRYLGDELNRIASALNQVTGVRLDTQASEPSRYADGDVVYADGTNWNPGGGAGAYTRDNGAWVKVGGDECLAYFLGTD